MRAHREPRCRFDDPARCKQTAFTTTKLACEATQGCSSMAPELEERWPWRHAVEAV